MSGAYAARGEAAASEADRGVCSECGLAFAWIDVSDPLRHNVPWLFEHAPRRGSSKHPHARLPRLALRRAWSTLARTLWPHRFWHQVTLYVRVSPSRLMMWLPVLIVPLHFVWALTSVWRRFLYLRSTAPGWNVLAGTQWETFFANAWVYPIAELSGTRAAGWSIRFREPAYSFLLPLGASLFMPLLLAILSRTRATSKIRLAHVLRSGVYGLGWIVWWYALWTALSLIAAVKDTWSANVSLRVLTQRTGTVLPSPREIGAACVAIWIAWFAAYWWYAISRGMRMARPALTWGLLMTACLLAGALATRLDQDLWKTIGDWLR